MIGRLLVCLAGLLLCAGTGYGIYWLGSLIFGGALAGNWLMVIAGGILAYLFIGLLVAGFIIGIVIILAGAFD
jgi:hypothetical protein